MNLYLGIDYWAGLRMRQEPSVYTKYIPGTLSIEPQSVYIYLVVHITIPFNFGPKRVNGYFQIVLRQQVKKHPTRFIRVMGLYLGIDY